nr:putative toxin-antitoxin system toxin component, PIN family [Nanoarchaeum sp.]
MLKLVLDTNTLVSAFFWEGDEAKLFREIEKGRAILFISKEILQEIEKVIIRPKFIEVMNKAGLTSDQIIQKIISVSRLVIGPKLNILVCRDKEDNKFLECAQNAKVHYIVSGDKDLLNLKRYKNIKIVTTSEILRLLR